MRGYESILIIDASLPEEEINNITAKFRAIVEDSTSELVYESTWGRRRLAYEINKKQYGVYQMFYIKGDETVLHELERQAGYDEKVLKFFAVRADDLEVQHQKFETLKANPQVNVDLLTEDAQGGL